ncbi:hypothetical protein D3C71_194760 [compost metagenome]
MKICRTFFIYLPMMNKYCTLYFNTIILSSLLLLGSLYSCNKPKDNAGQPGSSENVFIAQVNNTVFLPDNITVDYIGSTYYIYAEQKDIKAKNSAKLIIQVQDNVTDDTKYTMDYFFRLDYEVMEGNLLSRYNTRAGNIHIIKNTATELEAYFSGDVAFYSVDPSTEIRSGYFKVRKQP